MTSTYCFDTLCGSRRAELVNFAYRFTANRARSEDVVQDAMAKAWISWSKWDPKDHNPRAMAYAWLRQIVKNCFINDYTKNRRWEDLSGKHGEEIAGNVHAGEDEALTQIADNAYSDEMSAALAALSEDYRAPLLLKEIDELSYKEIALKLNIPIGTVMSRLFRGKNELAKSLGAARVNSARRETA